MTSKKTLTLSTFIALLLLGCNSQTQNTASLKKNALCQTQQNKHLKLVSCSKDDDSNQSNVSIYASEKLIYQTDVANDPKPAFIDANHDGVDDVLLHAGYDVRSNEHFHLLLIQPDTQPIRVVPVAHFEQIKNPLFLSPSVIASPVVSGQNYIAFYQLTNSTQKNAHVCQYDVSVDDDTLSVSEHLDKLDGVNCDSLTAIE